MTNGVKDNLWNILTPAGKYPKFECFSSLLDIYLLKIIFQENDYCHQFSLSPQIWDKNIRLCQV